MTFCVPNEDLKSHGPTQDAEIPNEDFQHPVSTFFFKHFKQSVFRTSSNFYFEH